MKKIYFWSPFNSKIGTINSVINSIKSINKFSNENYKSYLIDSTSEWKNYDKIFNLIYLRKNKQDYRNYKNKGFFWSRIFFLKIFFSCFFPMKRILKINNPDYLIAHLITSLPLILFFLFKFNTKLILRISGEPNLNFFRKYLWKIVSKKIFAITCPCETTKQFFINENIFDSKKIHVLFDPVLTINEFKNKKNKEIESDLRNTKYFLSVGRLTKQKNFSFLISCFNKLRKNYPEIKLVILGEGEEKNNLQNQILSLGLENIVILKGFKENVFSYMKNATCLILASLYENPGHVLIEAAISNCPIISSDCPTGPAEFLNDGKAGHLFELNNERDLIREVENFINQSDKEKIKRTVMAKKNSINYTIFRHYLSLRKII
tara:strand:+ start:440 stop:1570 length:1131 start_codon:yes stop_codon:yes gene_type:complete